MKINRTMKTVAKALYTTLIAATCLILTANTGFAQPGAPLPSEESWNQIQQQSYQTPQLPSEQAYNDMDLRATRPTDQVPIGGIDAPLTTPSITALIAFALAAAAIQCARKRKYSR